MAGRRRAGRAIAPALLVVLLAAACAGGGTDVTGSAGQPTRAQSDPVAPPAADADPQLLAGLPPCPDAAPAEAVPDGLPAITLACLGPGGPVTLSGLAGTPVIINAWASWCQPCRSELPALASFSQRASKEVAVLGLNVADAPDAAAALWSELAIPFPSVTDPDSTTRAELSWIGLPVTYFVDERGVIVARHSGAVTDPDTWQRLAEQHLGIA